ncbi:DMT family transporter [Erwinia piriflorinigrans]|uniref:Putative transporter ydeD n=1 Tax=Erwinia piriflorinigrans CFBP 5888 TaxID=1161919 RepID=V5ZCA6_9GAMM|nr:DMT family transporter [Erwinia piriflorinigrans]CCG88672.1 putative transporter ydeD [Erwinia piriflorinigrans CFBP 5888]
MKNVKSFAFVHACTLLFGLSALIGNRADSGIMTLIFGRGVFAFLALAAIMLVFVRCSTRARLSDIGRLMLSGALLGLHWICFFNGVKQGGIAVGTLGFACFPAFVTLFEAIIVRQLPSATDGIIIILIISGLLVISHNSAGSAIFSPGLAWGIAAGFTNAIFIIFNRYVRTSATPLESSLWLCAGCTLFSLPGARGLFQSSFEDLGMLMILGIFCTALAFTLLIFGSRDSSAKSVSFIIALEPVYAILLAWILLAQPVNLSTGFGASLIVGAAILSTQFNKQA